ncbi:MAG: type II toxin-antitoxin system ParD family antitoxin [Acidobacteria bacterium]|nr:type II toxin-antitoxin system ParD family antitoxin [Acidobacteriota bacterium]
MDVHLTPELEKIVQSKLETGRYHSASEVISEALRVMEQRDEVRRKIDRGLESLRHGKGIDGHEAFVQLDARHNRYKRKKR